MLKAVIFDMDGVIIDSEPVHLKLEYEIYNELGIDITREEHSTFVGTTSHYMWDTLKKKYKLSQELDYLVNHAREKYFNHLTSEECEIDLVEGVRDFIRKLHERGTKLAIASSSPLNVIEAVVKIFKLEEYFEVLVTGDMVEKSKPEPDIFLYAAEKLGAAPNECIVIEDSHNGARAAKKAGMKCIGYKNPSSSNQDISMADLVVEAFSEVDVDRLFK